MLVLARKKVGYNMVPTASNIKAIELENKLDHSKEVKNILPHKSKSEGLNVADLIDHSQDR